MSHKEKSGEREGIKKMGCGSCHLLSEMVSPPLFSCFDLAITGKG